MKQLSNLILEGSWGYEPDQGDSVLDLRGDIIEKLLEKIYDECFKRVWSNDEDIAISGNSCWDVVGTIEYFFEKCTYLFDIGGRDDDPDYEKYYYWWALENKKHKNIIELYKEAISRCARDKEFIDSWKEPEKMKASIKKRFEILKKYSNYRDEYFRKELDLDKKRVDDVIETGVNPQQKTEDIVVDK